ncbi:MAG: PIN domain-containing protein [Candidatus Methanoperedens sp.]|nr:PIN domain-containing protein [Candidatus Methanoperedens sp.]
MSALNIEEGAVVGLDANLFLYVATKNKKYSDSCTNLFGRIRDEELIGVTSVIILDEVVYKIMLFEVMEKYGVGLKEASPMLKNKPEIIKNLEKPKRILQDIIAMGVEIKPLDVNMMIYAEEISRKYLLKPHDAILVATLKKFGVNNIVTNDLDFERIEGFNIWRP